MPSIRHSSGKGGYGNLAPVVVTDVDFGKLSLEEQEARAKLHTHEHGFMTGKGESPRTNAWVGTDCRSFSRAGGAGNYHGQLSEDTGRGRDSNRSNGGGGLIQNIFRSLSRSTAKRE